MNCNQAVIGRRTTWSDSQLDAAEDNQRIKNTVTKAVKAESEFSAGGFKSTTPFRPAAAVQLDPSHE